MSLNVSSDAPVIEKKDEEVASKSGNSEPIPSVQEIVKEDPCDVPEEYIRTQPLDGPEPILHHLSAQIPIIDFSLVKKGEEEELSKLDWACREWGYFQLVNHGAEDTIRRVKHATAQFFEQSLEEKRKYAMVEENSEGYGHIEVHHPDEHLEKRDWSDAVLLLTQPVEKRDLKYWPTYPKEYPILVDRFSSETYQIGVDLIKAFSQNLGLSEDANIHEPHLYFFANYYPPCSRPDKVLGMDVHSDENTMTFAIQDQEDATALQIKHKEGFVPVNPISDAIIVNIGDLIEAWSNGKYNSVEHRAITINTKVRSIHQAIFIPPPDAVVEPAAPAAHAVDQLLRAHRKLYSEIRVGDYSYLYTRNKKHDGRSKINSLKI